MSRDPSPRPVETTPSETLEHRLRSYSVAAAAAGVGMLALAHPAEAEVVITHKIIQVNHSVSIDINNDGIADFQFGVGSSRNGYVFFAQANVSPVASGGGVVGNGGWASALQRDVKIGRLKHFSDGGVLERFVSSCKDGSCGSYTGGDWRGDPQNRFLGVKLLIDGETHYGWVRMKVLSTTHIEIESYAYETIANKAICARVVGECPTPDSDSEEIGQSVGGGPSLGMLALGAEGLALWRRQEASPLLTQS